MANRADSVKDGGRNAGGDAGATLARTRGTGWAIPFRLFIVLPVGIAVLVHAAGRVAYWNGYSELYTADAWTLGSIMLALASAVLIMHHVYRTSVITYATIAAVLCILAGQAINVMDHHLVWGAYGPAETVHGVRTLIKEVCFVSGIALLISVFVMSLYESNRARKLLADACADVERKVEDRTASLVEANRKLEQEIRVRREAEEAFRLSEEKFRALVENSADIIIRLDTELHILYANPTVMTTMGGIGGNLNGRSVASLLGFGHATEAWHKIARQVLESGEPGRVATSRGEGDELHLLDWSMAPETDTAGRVISLLAVARDMTELWHKELERRALEEQLVQSQKLESVGRLAGGIAHDFNNLLQVICGYLEFAMAEVEEEHSAYGRLRQMDKAARRATNLVRQLLAFSRRETMRCEPIDINRLIFDMAEMFRHVLGERYSINIAASLETPLVVADVGHVEQVLMNLCVNAHDAMPEGGVIHIETRPAHVSKDSAAHPERRPGDYVETIVSDSGAGMTPEVVSRIFEPFFTTKETGKGTGLGLAVVYGIVRQHGGFLNVDSRPGVGTAFSFFLPVAPAGALEVAAGAESAPAADGHGETIFLAEDEEQVRSLVKDILEEAGYRVIEAVDGLEALEVVENRCGEIDLFMLDAIMPLKSGREVFEAVVARRPDARVLFVTGQSFNIFTETNLPERGYELLHKPFLAKDLLAKVRLLLDS